jgi:nitroreductase
MSQVRAPQIADASADHVLTTTRAVRKRLNLDRPVPPEVVEECIEIALQAPTSHNSEPWRWVAVSDPELRAAIAEVYRDSIRLFFETNADEVARERTDPTMARALASGEYLAANIERVPVLVIPMIGGKLGGLPADEAASAWGSILPAMWSFMLAARARALGTVWTVRHLYYHGDRRVAELLGIPHDQYTQVGLIPVAYTIGESFRPAKRRPLDEVFGWNRFPGDPDQPATTIAVPWGAAR